LDTTDPELLFGFVICDWKKLFSFWNVYSRCNHAGQYSL